MILTILIGMATGLLTYALIIVAEDFHRDHPGLIHRILWGVQK